MTEIVLERAGYDIEAARKRARTRPEYYQERILLDVARQIGDIMNEQGVSRAELARKLGVSQAYITKALRGTENFSLKTLTQIAFALGTTWELVLLNRDKNAKTYYRTGEEPCIRHACVAEATASPHYVSRNGKSAQKRAGKKHLPRLSKRTNTATRKA